MERDDFSEEAEEAHRVFLNSRFPTKDELKWYSDWTIKQEAGDLEKSYQASTIPHTPGEYTIAIVSTDFGDLGRIAR